MWIWGPVWYLAFKSNLTELRFKIGSIMLAYFDSESKALLILMLPGSSVSL